MPNNLDTNRLKQQLEKLKQAVVTGRFGDALVGAINTGSAIMQQRIFNVNEDVEGNGFGVYIGRKKKISQFTLNRLLSKASETDKKRISKNADLELTPYQRKRVNKGRQIVKKDLEFTGGERRSIETQIESDKSAILQFNNDLAVKIARGQENQINNIRQGKPGKTKGSGAPRIFALSKQEKEIVIEQAKELVKQILKNG